MARHPTAPLTRRQFPRARAPVALMRKGQAIMLTSHRSATRVPGARLQGRDQGARRRGGVLRSARWL